VCINSNASNMLAQLNNKTCITFNCSNDWLKK